MPNTTGVNSLTFFYQVYLTFACVVISHYECVCVRVCVCWCVCVSGSCILSWRFSGKRGRSRRKETKRNEKRQLQIV